MAAWASLDTFTAPPGYWEALKYNLAVRQAPEMQDGEIPPTVLAIAREALARIQGMNAPSPLLRADEGMPRASRSNFNCRTGE